MEKSPESKNISGSVRGVVYGYTNNHKIVGEEEI
jgi:hypothetical protein